MKVHFKMTTYDYEGKPNIEVGERLRQSANKGSLAPIWPNLLC